MSDVSKINVNGTTYQIRDSSASSWVRKTLTPNSSYISGTGYSTCYYNVRLKLAILSINCNLSSTATSGSALISGLPKSLATRATGCISQGTATAPAARVFINQSGNLITDGALPSTGWYNGCIVYPYSSL